MESLKSLRAQVAKVEHRLSVFERQRAQHQAAVARCEAEIQRLEGGTTKNGAIGASGGFQISVGSPFNANIVVARRKPKSKPGAFAAWLRKQKLPATIPVLAQRAKFAGFSGKPNVIATVAGRSPGLRRLKDGRVGRA